MLNPTRIDVLPIQEVVATASPSAWQDGLVMTRDQDATTVVLLDGAVRVLSTQAAAGPGEPVAVHPVAEVLAVGGTWYTARPLGSGKGGEPGEGRAPRDGGAPRKGGAPRDGRAVR